MSADVRAMITRLGGAERVARLLEIHERTVRRWLAKRPKRRDVLALERLEQLEHG